MLNLNCKIKVYETKGLQPSGKVYQFTHVKNIVINSSYKNFTDTATITIPKAIVANKLNDTLGIQIARRLPVDLKERSVHEFFKIDYYVEIFLGYNGESKPAFRGYIREVKGDAPVQIECDDMMYYLKKYKMVATGKAKEEADEDEKNQIPKNNSKTNNKLKETLEKRLKEINIPFFDATKITIENVGDIVIDRSWNIVKFLKELREKYDIYSYFRLEKEKDIYKSVLHITNNPCLYTEEEINTLLEKHKNVEVKTPLPKALLKRAISLTGVGDVLNFFKKDDTYIGEGRLRFHYNIINDSLKLAEEKVKKVRLRAEEYYVNSNIPIASEIGDLDGALEKKYVFHNNKEELDFEDPIKYKKKTEEIKAKLEVISGLRLARLKQKGLTGTITTFGEPFMRPLDKIGLENSEDPEKEGVFLVEEVQRSYGTQGYRQKITVGRLLKKEKKKEK
ncbi:hypothetical protein [Tenacibaculum ovolyticum]|uniref:hypothetical protein n=1 Tax=Tenacibaculum ovolyticum TaxID=104270 RepID=UPI000401DBD0|nr:hypothetical protein [Tenacibaculum ovolyticum]